MTLGNSGVLMKDWRNPMSDVMLHGVLNMPINMWKDSEIDKVQRHARYVEASNRIKQLEQELDQEQRKYKPDTTVEQMRETLRDSMLEHKAVITEQDKEITELKGRINKYLDIFDSINYLPPDISASHIRSMITEKLQRML